jgi:hypothetical protein
MPALAAKFSVAAAAAVVAWAGFEAVRSLHVVAQETPPPVPNPVIPPAREAPKLNPVVITEAKANEPQEDAPAAWGVAAMARIHGRVVGGGKSDELPKVTAEDPSHSYDADVAEDGRYEINLPVGHYALVATAGDLVAVADVAGLAEGESRDVTLVLGAGVTIKGKVRAPDASRLDANIKVLPAGASRADFGVDGSGEFVADGLVPGRKYDLIVTASGMRNQTIRNVVAPSRGLDVTLEEAPVLRGGFGLAAVQECPLETARIATTGNEEVADVDVVVLLENDGFDEACRFELHNLPDAPSVHVTASGWGWHFEADVALPEHGNPEFLCLRKPCRDTGP